MYQSLIAARCQYSRIDDDLQWERPSFLPGWRAHLWLLLRQEIAPEISLIIVLALYKFILEHLSNPNLLRARGGWTILA